MAKVTRYKCISMWIIPRFKHDSSSDTISLTSLSPLTSFLYQFNDAFVCAVERFMFNFCKCWNDHESQSKY